MIEKHTQTQILEDSFYFLDLNILAISLDKSTVKKNHNFLDRSINLCPIVLGIIKFIVNHSSLLQFNVWLKFSGRYRQKKKKIQFAERRERKAKNTKRVKCSKDSSK